MIGKKPFKLLLGEVILFETCSNKGTHEYRGNKTMLIIFNLVYVIMIGIFIYLFITNKESIHINPENNIIQRFVFLLIPIISAFFFLVGSFYYYGRNMDSRHAKYYFTSKRIIKFIERSYYFHKPKVYDIFYDKLSHVFNWVDALEFAPVNITGKSYFKGDETKLRYPLLKCIPSIKIYLDDVDQKDEKLKIIQIVKNHCKLHSHPLHDFLYIQ